MTCCTQLPQYTISYSKRHSHLSASNCMTPACCKRCLPWSGSQVSVHMSGLAAAENARDQPDQPRTQLACVQRVREKVRHHKDRQYHHVHEMRMAMHRGERDLARKLEQRVWPA